MSEIEIHFGIQWNRVVSHKFHNAKKDPYSDLTTLIKHQEELKSLIIALVVRFPRTAFQ